VRLFAALELDAAVRRAIAERIAAERDALPPAAWVREANLHLTLAFFGEVAPERVDSLAAALAAAAAASPRLALRSAAAGAFPPRGAVRVVWLALEPAAALGELAARLREATARLAVPFDAKPFRSHVTLARCRRPWPAATRERLAGLAPPEPARFVANGAALVASELAPGGSGYRTVARLDFAEAA
jgi:2'-5' RNA ligase